MRGLSRLDSLWNVCLKCDLLARIFTFPMLCPASPEVVAVERLAGELAVPQDEVDLVRISTG